MGAGSKMRESALSTFGAPFRRAAFTTPLGEVAMLIRRTAVVAALLGALAIPVWAQPAFEGFLCCNLRTDGSWASDSNYAESGKRIIPVGTPVRVTGYGRYRVLIEVNGGKQAIGNDYSRDIDLG